MFYLALKQYDGVPLDGRPMKIEMASDANSLRQQPMARPRSASVSRNRANGGRVMKRGGSMNRSGGMVKRGGAQGRGRTGGRGGRGGARGAGRIRGGVGGAKGNVRNGPKRGGRGGARGGKKPAPVDREQLDKELDSFMKQER